MRRVLVASVMVLAAQHAEARECAYWSGNGPSVYGGSSGLDESYASHVDTAGMGGLRINFRIDGNATWTPALLAQYDDYMAVAKEHGIDVLGMVLYESLPGSQADWNSGYDSTGYSPYVQSFVDTAKLLMDRYGDQVKYWEIWNEPNCWSNPSYQTDPTHAGCTYVVPLVYAKMLAETFVQNQATIVSKGLHLVSGGLFAHDIGGSFSPATDYATAVFQNGPWDWLQSTYGRRYPWDGFGYHIYIDQGAATSSAHVLQYIDAIQATKVSYSDFVPLWLTEFGWSTKSVNEAQQASNIDTALSVFESRGDVARTFVFKVDDYDGWGIFRSDWTSKPAFATLQAHDKGCAHLPVVPLDAGIDAEAPADGSADGEAPGSPEPSTHDDETAPSSGCACQLEPSVSGGHALALLLAGGLLRRGARARSRSSRR